MSDTFKVSWPLGQGVWETHEWPNFGDPLFSRKTLDSLERYREGEPPPSTWCNVSDGQEERMVFLQQRFEAHFPSTKTFGSILAQIDLIEESNKSPEGDLGIYPVCHNATRIMCFLFTQYMPELAEPRIALTPDSSVLVEFQGLNDRVLTLTVAKNKGRLAGRLLKGEGSVCLEYGWEDTWLDDHVAKRIAQAVVGFVESGL